MKDVLCRFGEKQRLFSLFRAALQYGELYGRVSTERSSERGLSLMQRSRYNPFLGSKLLYRPVPLTDGESHRNISALLHRSQKWSTFRRIFRPKAAPRSRTSPERRATPSGHTATPARRTLQNPVVRTQTNTFD